MNGLSRTEKSRRRIGEGEGVGGLASAGDMLWRLRFRSDVFGRSALDLLCFGGVLAEQFTRYALRV